MESQQKYVRPIEYFSIDEACRRGENFLLSSAHDHGWSDFNTLIGESTHWVTGYVLDCLSDHPGTKAIIGQIAAYLSSEQQWNGGWAYNKLAPADADSTAAVLSAVANIKSLSAWRKRRGIKFLLRHANSLDGGFKTFKSNLRLKLLMQAYHVSYQGWQKSHTCVTSAAIISLLKYGYSINDPVIKEACDFLVRLQKNNGLWYGYWWEGPYYATAMAIRALKAAKYSIPNSEFTASSIFELQQKNSSWESGSEKKGCIFSTALALSCVKHYLTSENLLTFKMGVNWLIRQQNSNGSWSAEPILRIPEPYDINPEKRKIWINDGLGTSSRVRSQNHIFITATVVKVLHEIRCGYSTEASNFK